MSTVESMLEELRELTGTWWSYQHEIFAYSGGMLEHKHKLISPVTGFGVVEKETLEDLLEALPLIKEKVGLLSKAERVQKQIDVKLIRQD